MSNNFDVIVVGAGPGGATAAFELARAGARVLLIEKQKLPRHKTCGGGVTHKVAQCLPFDISPVVERTIHTAVFSYQMENPFELRSEQPLVYMTRRNTLDYFLVEHAVNAGAVLIDDNAVRGIDNNSEGVTVRTDKGVFTSSWLVGADGATGMVARSQGLMNDVVRMPAMESEVEVNDTVSEYWHDKMGLDLGVLPATYGWVFPKNDHLNVGVGGIAKGDDFGKRLKNYDAQHLAKRVPIQQSVRKSFGYVLPVRQLGSPICKGRVLLIGDAAGLVEVFTGEGIYWAVRSGQIAAQTILNGRAAAEYEHAIDSQLMPDLISARRWSHLYVWFPKLCYTMPKRWQPMWGAVCKMMRGERGYAHIRKKLGVLGFMESFIPASV